MDDAGKLKTFRDVYGHEKRITQALDGEWEKINKGRDHLAPVEPGFDPEAVAARAPEGSQDLPARPKRTRRSATSSATRWAFRFKPAAF